MIFGLALIADDAVPARRVAPLAASRSRTARPAGGRRRDAVEARQADRAVRRPDGRRERRLRRSSRGRSFRSSAPTAPARPRSSTPSPASTTPPAARFDFTGSRLPGRSPGRWPSRPSPSGCHRPGRRAVGGRTSTRCGGPRSSATTPEPARRFPIAPPGTTWPATCAVTLALEPVRGERWAVRTADGRRTLGYAKTQRRSPAACACGSQSWFPSAMRLTQAPIRLSGTAASGPSSRRASRWPRSNPRTTRSRRWPNMPRSPRSRARGRRNALVALVGGFLAGVAGMLGGVDPLAPFARSDLPGRHCPHVSEHPAVSEHDRAGQRARGAWTASCMAAYCGWRCRRPASAARSGERATKPGRLLAFVGLADVESMLAKNLPYGDQRRLEIARALATDPELILLDEPAAGMNPAESIELNGLIEQIRGRGLTVMLIEHHMSVVMGISDRIAVLEYGRKIAEGTPEEVRNDPPSDRRVPGQRRGALMAPLLAVENLHAGYGPIEVLKGLSLEVQPGEIVALIGANGAGKTSTLMSISGCLRPRGGRVLLEGREIQNLAAARDRTAWHLPFARGAQDLPAPKRAGKLADGGVRPERQAGDRTRSGARLRAVSDSEGAARPGRRHALGRRAADAGRGPSA